MFMVDSGAMITLHTERYGIMEVMHVLKTTRNIFVIWGHSCGQKKRFCGAESNTK
jgi:hypothetical protein